MINIYKYLDYRPIIKTLGKEKKISQKMLAASARIHTSYFSRVMSGDAEFSSSQLYMIGRDLTLNDWKLDYFLLLGEYANASNSSHQNFLKMKIEIIQKEKQKTISEMVGVETSLDKEFTRLYYQESITAEIHMYLTLEKYRKNPLLILTKVHIPDFKLKQELDKLEELGVISKENEKIIILKPHIHLDETSPLIPSTHINWRLEAINHLQKRLPRPSDHHISVVFTTNEEGKLKIREHFKAFILEAQKISTKRPEKEEVFHLNFDLY